MNSNSEASTHSCTSHALVYGGGGTYFLQQSMLAYNNTQSLSVFDEEAEVEQDYMWSDLPTLIATMLVST